MEIEERVKKIIQFYKTNNPFLIAKEKDIDIRYENIGSALGFTDTIDRCTTIHISTDTPEGLIKFICAHELGHIFLHKNLNIPYFTRITFFSQNKFEIQANTFGVEMLVLKVENGQTIEELSRLYGVPLNLMYLKRVGT